MKKEDLIALGLTDEQADKVVEGYGKMIPKSRLDDKIAEVTDYKNQLAERDTQLTELQSKATGNAELQEQITALQEQNTQAKTDFETQLQQKDFDIALNEALRDAKAKNPKAVKALLDTTTVTIVDGKLQGLDEQLTALKTSDDYLFTTDKLKGNTPPQGGTPPTNALTQEEFASKSYADRMQLISENPNIMKELK